MKTQLNDALRSLISADQHLQGAILADLDGQEVAVYPSERLETLRNCAAYTGIALRRLTVAERLSGRGVVRELAIDGDEGAVLAMVVADENQLVVSYATQGWSARLRPKVRRTAQRLEAIILGQ